MPARDRAAFAVGGFALVVGLATGCGQGGPTEYNADVRADFIGSCVEQQVNTGVAESQARSTCECAYTNISENVEFDDFSSAIDDLQEEPDATLPPVIADQVRPCSGSPRQ